MAENSKIEWTDHTFNPWVGCTKISPGCDHCYAETWAKRSGMVTWGEERRRTSAANWKQPLRWHASIPDGQRRRVFCASLADVFDNQVPDEWRADLWNLIRATPRLDWLLLTKRIGNVWSMVPFKKGIADLPQNVWLGISVVNQEEADRDIPKLLAAPHATVRFLSCEPLLADLVLWRWLESVSPKVNWVIVGGESGGHARPMEAEWAEHIRLQCRVTGTPFFFKQGSAANWPTFKDFASFPSHLQVRQWP